MRRIVSIFLACLVSVVFNVYEVHALEVAPAIQEITAPVGTFVEREIRLSNPTDQPVEVFFTVQKFGAGGGGSPVFLPPQDSSGLPEWIRVSHPKVRLTPRSEGAVRVRIDVPKTASPGSYTAAVFATERTMDGVTVEVAKRIATLWFVTVQGENSPLPEPVWQIDGLETVTRRHGWRTDVETIIRVKNTGNAHGIVTSNVLIDGFLTGATSTQNAARVLPEETRTISDSVSTFAPIDRLQVDVVLTAGHRVRTSVWVVNTRSSVLVFCAMIASMVGWRWSKRSRRGILGT